MKVKKRYVVLMSLVALVAAIGAFFPETPGIWEPDEKFNAANVAWMITATIFVLMMTPGLSFFYGGMVGRKNVISTILQSFIAMGIISMLWVVVGFSLSFGDDVGGGSGQLQPVISPCDVVFDVENFILNAQFFDFEPDLCQLMRLIHLCRREERQPEFERVPRRKSP